MAVVLPFASHLPHLRQRHDAWRERFTLGLTPDFFPFVLALCALLSGLPNILVFPFVCLPSDHGKSIILSCAPSIRTKSVYQYVCLCSLGRVVGIVLYLSGGLRGTAHHSSSSALSQGTPCCVHNSRLWCTYGSDCIIGMKVRCLRHWIVYLGS